MDDAVGFQQRFIDHALGLVVAGLVYTALEIGLGRRTATNAAAAPVREEVSDEL